MSSLGATRPCSVWRGQLQPRGGSASWRGDGDLSSPLQRLTRRGTGTASWEGLPWKWGLEEGLMALA